MTKIGNSIQPIAQVFPLGAKSREPADKKCDAFVDNAESLVVTDDHYAIGTVYGRDRQMSQTGGALGHGVTPTMVKTI